MSGQGGKATSNSSSSSQYAPQLMSLFRSARPTLNALSSQTAEGLRTGGVNSQNPTIDANLAAAREGYSTSQQTLKNNLASAGLANTSMGQEILGQNREQAGQAINAIPANTTDAFLAKSTPAVAGAGMTALSTAAGLDTSQGITPSMVDQGFGIASGKGSSKQNSGGSGGSAAAGAALGSMFGA